MSSEQVKQLASNQKHTGRSINSSINIGEFRPCSTPVSSIQNPTTSKRTYEEVDNEINLPIAPLAKRARTLVTKQELNVIQAKAVELLNGRVVDDLNDAELQEFLETQNTFTFTLNQLQKYCFFLLKMK
jgi:hypothetical protein